MGRGHGRLVVVDGAGSTGSRAPSPDRAAPARAAPTGRQGEDRRWIPSTTPMERSAERPGRTRPVEPTMRTPTSAMPSAVSGLSQLNALIELMRPAVQADGGDLALLSADVVTGVVEVQLQGACSSCAVSSSTLQGGVERILHDRLPWVTEVLGGVDESARSLRERSRWAAGVRTQLLTAPQPDPVDHPTGCTWGARRGRDPCRRIALPWIPTPIRAWAPSGLPRRAGGRVATGKGKGRHSPHRSATRIGAAARCRRLGG